MADYEAKVRAVLEPGTFDADIKALTSKVYPLNIKFDGRFNTQLSDLERRLRSLQNIQINPLGGGQGGNTFRSTINSITNQGNIAINQLRSALAGLNFDNNSIDAITRRMNDLEIAISRVTTTAQRDGRLTFTINGVDKIGRTIKLVEDLDTATGAFIERSRQLGQSFVQPMQGDNLRTYTAEFKRLMDLQTRINNTQLKIQGLDGNANINQITELRSQLSELQNEMNNFSQQNMVHFSGEQISAWTERISQGSAKLDEMRAKLEDARLRAVNGIQLKIDTGEFDASISKVESQFNRLGEASKTKYAGIKADLEELKRLQMEMTNTSDMDTRIRAYDQFEQTLKKVKNSLAQIPDEEKKMATSLQAAQLKNQMSTWLNNNSKAAQNYGSAIQNLISKVDQLNASGQLTTAQAQKIREEFLGIKMEATAAGEVGRSFSDSLVRGLKSITGVFDITSAIRLGIRYIKQMAQEVTKVDTAMTQLKIVTNASSSEYQQFYKSSVQTSKEIGSTVSDLIDSTTVYARLGYSMDESSTLAKYTGMLQNVGDIDVSSAQDAITAITKAFDVNVNEIESVMDKLVVVGKHCCPAA